MKRISEILSVLFSPLLVPTYGMILAAFLTILRYLPVNLLCTAVGITFVITCLIPVSIIMALFRSGMVSDPGLNERKERYLPYGAVVLCYLGCGFFFFKASAPLWLPMFFAGAALATVINVAVNYWWKISAHAAAMGGLVALLFRIVASHYALYNMNLWLSTVIILAGAVMTARVYLGRHTLWQVLAGCANGFICVYLMSML
ncbi:MULTISPECIES: phosphatase PAP2 family protein [Duncaniella]|uniref:phosphatase PAP2 family protein n=1 Tax=Duncaniella TaxID=2518495 RepID=UPI0010A375C8|nr:MULTISPECIES: phosphatase PAP2 family protein [Duncaniella]QCD40334.1 phosphatase PAP2 family protein [Duncaniella sp. C9]QCP71436.1 phosphatase PAP2 family protein [Duncaniella sp. B8]